MLLCYVDESGDEQPLVRDDSAPALVLAGLSVAEAKSHDLIWGYLNIKKRFENSTLNDRSKLSDLVRHEIKGSNLRADIRSERRRSSRRAFGILDAVMALLEQFNVELNAYIVVKSDAKAPHPFVYADGVAWLAEQFESQLGAASTSGIMILDARTKNKNIGSVHSITTRRFRSGGGMFPHLAESPLFGHSDGHVVLQLSDLVASALLFPMTCYAYCQDMAKNVHVHSSYAAVQDRYGDRLRGLEHRYLNGDGARTGGIIVRDERNHLPTASIFGETKRVREVSRRPSDPATSE